MGLPLNSMYGSGGPYGYGVPRYGMGMGNSGRTRQTPPVRAPQNPYSTTAGGGINPNLGNQHAMSTPLPPPPKRSVEPVLPGGGRTTEPVNPDAAPASGVFVKAEPEDNFSEEARRKREAARKGPAWSGSQGG